MDYKLSDRTVQFDEILDNLEGIRILLYLDSYNPEVLLQDLEKNLNIDNKDLREIITKLISLDLVIKQDNMYQLTKFGKVTVTNLKNI